MYIIRVNLRGKQADPVINCLDELAFYLFGHIHFIFECFRN